jgi:outer membrane biosynthesis protein TonB
MAKRKLRKVLFFISGASPTDDDRAEMEAFGQGHMVCQRNVLHIHDGDPIEEFDLVAGAVPAAYAEAAAAKTEPEVAPVPTVDPSAIAAESPLAPPPADPPADPPVAPPQAPETPPKAAAKPKPPAPKPEAAKGWKPNA